MGSSKNPDVNTGRWTAEEHQAFVDGLTKYGKDWKKIGNMIPTRSIVQIRTHAQKYFVKLNKDMYKGDQKPKGIPSISSKKTIDCDLPKIEKFECFLVSFHIFVAQEQ
eukprot:gb/GECG01009767.1/.p1 GENE.gb/GECG01009767.1/~~gb/GECG01009767.1/.p1  ORF type:complete len:108 (+),score=15.59 gb/GECG01009767.1/:1-324(+)